MTTLLKRLSVSMSEKMRLGDECSTPRTLTSSTSFNDFSMHVATDVDHEQGADAQGAAGAHAPMQASVFGSSAPTSGYAGLGSSAALKIPRSSMAHLLAQRALGSGLSGDAGTPRSSLDVPAPSSAATSPRASIEAPSPRSPGGPMGAAAEEPPSPRSPRTPGGRRKKQTKVDGMDYYEFCELIRSSSL
ncbi:hypothetical protein D9Q98_009141 [Chlorella vulgaris]|uniref:Uncharacterized protein n=1 Tax=Chlorella vulgaris TaxID=3077 RepID=A0A9D4YTL0_CHLVU|nr:hypothetical protein D9Q98_009141 [Chlorella vulgaris]